MTNYQKLPRDGVAQERVRRKHSGKGKEAKKNPLGPTGTGPQFKTGRGEEWFKEWWRKDGT